MNDMTTYKGQENFQMAPAAPVAQTALASIEQSRAVAEVQASIVLAKANPRNEQFAENKILTACKRKTLADCATYAYKRGGQLVTGPSIRLAEVLARCWGNINYGFREMGRGSDYSEVEAFAHDFESNVRVTRQFQVKHFRDKRDGGKALETERDKYELVASMAQRRVRACLLELIPGDIVEMAEDACKATLEKAIGDMGQQAEKIAEAFGAVGVDVPLLEAYLQRELKSLVPADVVNLRRILRSIRDGVATVDEFFGDLKPKEDINERLNAETPTPAKKTPPKKKPPEKPQKAPTKEEFDKDFAKGVQEMADRRNDRTTKHKPKPVTLTKEEQKKVDEFEFEIKEKTDPLEVDQWCMKHQNRVMAAFKNKAAQDKVFQIAEDYRKSLK